MRSNNLTGHLLALFTSAVWGVTFVSTKVLLASFSPIGILLSRYVLACIALLIVCPRMLRGTTLREELIMAAAGLSGVCLYQLIENIALGYTSASNVGVIVTTAPFFTAVQSVLFLKDGERLHKSFFIGFVIAMAGIALIGFNGQELHLDPRGDLLSLLAAVIWGTYSVLSKMVGEFGHPTVLTTRRIIAYGTLFMLPIFLASGADLDLGAFAQPANLLNMLFLGILASALCLYTWNHAVKLIGAVRTCVYIYLSPVITVLTAILVLGEVITLQSGTGICLTLAGLILSEWPSWGRARKLDRDDGNAPSVAGKDMPPQGQPTRYT